MYKPRDGQMSFFDYFLEDTFTLDPENRWMKMSQLVPWEKAEEKYSHMFSKNGRRAKDIRMALGALLIQEILKTSDEETVLAIMENPYLQHFIGLQKFTNKAPFDASLMVWFRKRMSKKFINEINEEMCKRKAQPTEEKPPENDDEPPHGGTLILDATCTPADITYPTDTGLLADAIEKTDEIIDIMQKPLKGKKPRPRTYRIKSRKLFKGFVKQRKPSKNVIRKVKGKQLNYLKRNLSAINKMLEEGGELSDKQVLRLETIRSLYNQQREMHTLKANRTDDRIVSISQPHIRPIVRGKAGKSVEFGAKVEVSVVNGYVFVNEISYDNFNESGLLENAVIDYITRFGMLPKIILADKIYRTRENLKFCKELGIRLSGKPLGRPSKTATADNNKLDNAKRNEVEGKIGTLKTRYGWNRIMARLPETGMTAISVAVMAMNLVRMARFFVQLFLRRLFLKFRATFITSKRNWKKIPIFQ